MSDLGMHNAVWDDGEWVSWDSINSELERLELKARFPKADISLIPVFEELLRVASDLQRSHKRHLHIYGDLGELYGAIHYGIKLNKNYAMGSDGRLGKDLVEIKTISPFNKSRKTAVRLDRNFSMVLVVNIDEDFEFSSVLIRRKDLPAPRGQKVELYWDRLQADAVEP